MEKVTEIFRARVVTDAGDVLGRVVDLHSRGEPEHGESTAERFVTALVVGKHYWLDRFGLCPADLQTISWDRVRRIDGRTIVVAVS